MADCDVELEAHRQALRERRRPVQAIERQQQREEAEEAADLRSE